ncbi:thermonuclease family protein [Terrisporobacter sp.]
MKFYKKDKLKSLLLAGVFSLSLLFSGCSSDIANVGTLNNSNTTTSTDSTNNSNTESSTNSTNNKNNATKNDSTDNSNDKTTTNSLNNTNLPRDASKATIERVVDGDTVKVRLKGSGEIVTLRLLLIDTPESVKPGVDPQPYSKEASNFAKQLLQSGDTVYLEYDNGDKTDKYGRHLCYLWYYDNKDNSWKMYNETIVEKGLARVGYVYSQRKHLNELYKAQDKAKANKLNIWSVNGYVTDRGFDVDAYYNKNTSYNNNSSKTNSYNNTTSNHYSYNNDSSQNYDSSQNDSDSGDVVYANGGASSSNKYHTSEHAHGMKGAIKMTESQAKLKGYSPCGLCYK